MGTTTAISWTDHTFNPWWGCERVSPGCQHCYAEAFAKRTGNAVWGKTADRRHFGDKHWNEPLKWNRAAQAAGLPALVFCASMADVFEDRRDLDEDRARLFELIEATPWLRWQLLTKRPENVLRLVPRRWLDANPIATGCAPYVGKWPANCWIGCTVEDQQRADERVHKLLEVPAPVLFLSCEPLLGPILLDLSKIGWVIVGGESGPGHRPMYDNHAHDLCQQVIEQNVPLFFKQWGGRTPTAGGHLIDLGDGPAEYHEFPTNAGDRTQGAAATAVALDRRPAGQHDARTMGP